MSTPGIDEALAILRKGTETIVSEESLAERLKSKPRLRVKLGVDPTAPDIHLGHAVQLRKLRDFQDLGHHVVLIIGDFTAMIGDPSGRSATRPPLTHEEVMVNAKTFTDQAFLVLDPDQTEIVYNGDWFAKMPFNEVIKLNSRVTMQQMMQREDFKERIQNKQEVRLHEIQYPIMQGWDSVMVKSDVEIGGTDQLFNILVGRDLQKAEGQPPQIVMTLPLLEGLDGVKKMSKSLGNYVGLTDEPDDMFGKMMSISDEMMPRYALLVLGTEIDPALHPMEAKKTLAGDIVSLYHSPSAANDAREAFEARFSKGNLDEVELPSFEVPAEPTGLITLVVAAYADCFQQKRSNGEARRLIQQGSIQINGEKTQDPKSQPAIKAGDVLKLDKKRSVRFQ
ncbi:MAG: tyrosine--tRNA ligase [Verrucomicrobiota bacterium]